MTSHAPKRLVVISSGFQWVNDAADKLAEVIGNKTHNVVIEPYATAFAARERLNNPGSIDMLLIEPNASSSLASSLTTYKSELDCVADLTQAKVPVIALYKKEDTRTYPAAEKLIMEVSSQVGMALNQHDINDQANHAILRKMVDTNAALRTEQAAVRESAMTNAHATQLVPTPTAGRPVHAGKVSAFTAAPKR